MFDETANLVWDAVGKPLARAIPSEPGEVLGRVVPFGASLPRILVTQLIEAERAAISNFDRTLNRIRVLPKQSGHLPW